MSVLLFALLCAVIAYWMLRLLEPPVRIAPSGSLAAAETIASLGPAQTLFGRAGAGEGPIAQSVASNFKVLGVIADTQRGAAIIAVDGGAAEVFGVGMQIDDTHRLKSVSATEVVIQRGAEEIRIDAPAQSDVAILSSGPAPGAPGVADSRPAPPARPLPPSGAAAAAQEQDAPRPVVRRPAPPAPGTGAQTQAGNDG